ncbi:UNVERIFIED_CONTAM: hypothetical protein Slati_4563100 [Sesamum latifolium]|uniref:Uncharacterized protein n=1 Tax=Sesamum latifolium TaxID=2727402 RepID=A0AAW2RP80_9LAMI
MVQNGKKVRSSALSMSSPVTSLFFFKPIIGGGRCSRGGLGAGGGQGQGGPPAAPGPRPPPWLGRGLCWPCFGENPASFSGGALERRNTVLRAADAYGHRVRWMPSRPQRQTVGGEPRLR